MGLTQQTVTQSEDLQNQRLLMITCKDEITGVLGRAFIWYPAPGYSPSSVTLGSLVSMLVGMPVSFLT